MTYYVSRIVQHGPVVKEFCIRKQDDSALTPWEAGAHVRLSFCLKNGEPIERHYSLVGEPGVCDEYRIAVLNEIHGTGGSAHLHANVQVGDLLTLSGPFNSFPMQATTGRTILIAGGIGITPLVSMAHVLAHADGQCEMHYLARSQDRLVLIDEVRAALPGKIFVHLTGKDRARVKLHHLLGTYSPGSTIYACGPNSLLHDVEDAARLLGWPHHALHFESFGARSAQSDKPVLVHLALSDMTLEVFPGSSILDAMIKADVFVSYECKRGECANCFAQVIDGVPLHRDVCLSEQQRNVGMCTCVSWASSQNLTLEL